MQVHRSLCCFIRDELEEDDAVLAKMIWNSVEVKAGRFVMRPQKLHGVEQGGPSSCAAGLALSTQTPAIA